MAPPRSAPSTEGLIAPDLTAQVRVLETRLREGEEVLRRAQETGVDPDLLRRWEVAWIKLLRQYELLYDRLGRQAAGERARRAQEAP